MMSKQTIKHILPSICLTISFFLTYNLMAATSPETKATTSVKNHILAEDKVYVMYVESCPMCTRALKEINKNYKDNPYLVRVNLETPKGKVLLQQCRKKFGFKDVIIPLICAKDEYFMGWSTTSGQKLKTMIEKIYSSQ